jgi:hypothetical protein
MVTNDFKENLFEIAELVGVDQLIDAALRPQLALGRRSGQGTLQPLGLRLPRRIASVLQYKFFFK